MLSDLEHSVGVFYFQRLQASRLIFLVLLSIFLELKKYPKKPKTRLMTFNLLSHLKEANPNNPSAQQTICCHNSFSNSMFGNIIMDLIYAAYMLFCTGTIQWAYSQSCTSKSQVEFALSSLSTPWQGPSVIKKKRQISKQSNRCGETSQLSLWILGAKQKQHSQM